MLNRTNTAAVGALAALAAVPVLAAGIRLAGGWFPTGDPAIIVLRSMDVATSPTPLVGMPTTLSQSIGEQAFHLGPSEFWLLWLASVVDGSAGSPVWAVALANAVWLAAAVWWCGRLGGLPAAALGASLVLVSVVGLDAWVLADPRNPYVALGAYVCFVTAAPAVVAGHRWALPWAVAAGSFAAHAHLSFVPVVGAVVVAGLVALSVALIRRWRPGRELLWPSVTAGALAVGLWWPVALDQFTRTGNVSSVLRAGGDETATGPAGAWDFLVHGIGAPQRWLSGHTDPVNVFVDNSVLDHIVAVVALAAGTAVAIAAHRHHRALASCAQVAVISLVAGTVSMGRLPVEGFGGFASHNHLWLRPAGALLWATLACAAVLALRRLVPASERLAVPATAGLVGVAAVLSLAALVGPVEQQDNPSVALARDGVEALSQRLDPAAPYHVRAAGEQTLTGLTAALVLGLERDGFEVYVDDDLAAGFGEHRSVSQAPDERVLLHAVITDGAPLRPPGSVEVLHLEPDERALAELATAEGRLVERISANDGLELASGQRLAVDEATELVRSGGIATLWALGQISTPELDSGELDDLVRARSGRIRHLYVFADEE